MKKIDNAEIDTFIENIKGSFEKQRNMLLFMKKIGNVDNSELSKNAAYSEIVFAVDRVSMLRKVMYREAPLSDETVAAVEEFMQQLCDQVREDVGGIDADISLLPY